MVSMVTDHRVPKKYVGRLVLQEYDDEQKKMVGPVREIFCADKVYLEGPHIFKRKDWQYRTCCNKKILPRYKPNKMFHCHR